MHENVNIESICKANAQFWEQMLAMRLEPVAQATDHLGQLEQSERCIGEGHVVGSCRVAGAWNGRIEVRLAGGLATEATAAMLMQPAATVAEADMLDATREIANMIAGTIKSVLPRPCTMTVPHAEAERGDYCIPPRTGDSVTVFFRHQSGELMVRVHELEMTLESDE